MNDELENAASPATAPMHLLEDIELDATLQFGQCEMPLRELLALGPGDVVELDRHVSDPVDLIVGHRIVSEPQFRLESIRCLS
jgi:flagellar motor switch protein FliN/FliY